MVLNACPMFFAAGGGWSPGDDVFQGFSPLVAYDLTDASSVTTAVGDFLTAAPVPQSTLSGPLATVQGTPEYVTTDGPNHVRLVNVGAYSKLQVSFTFPTPPANADATILAVYKTETDISGIVFDSTAPRSVFLPNGANAFAAISGSTLLGAVSPALAVAANTLYGSAVTGSTVDTVAAWHAELGNAIADSYSSEAAQSTTFPTTYTVGERQSGSAPLVDGHIYGFAIFDTILSSADIQTIFDRFNTKF